MNLHIAGLGFAHVESILIPTVVLHVITRIATNIL